MFASSIEEVSKFTRPIHTIARNYKETIVSPGAATLFFVNEEGVAVTCKHVVDLIGNRQAINDRYEKFKAEKNAIGKNNKYNQRLKALETSYNLKEGVTIQLMELFAGVTSEKKLNYKWLNHPKYDLSILIFEDLKSPLYTSHAKFLRNGSDIKQGNFLCRLGFPFPEFTNFQYNTVTDNIEWTSIGKIETPRFPIEGMVTRHLADETGIMGIEMSSPGLRGQSGGPLFNKDGVIYGMQTTTNHLHLGFDMKNFEYKQNGRIIKVSNQPFLHVAQCIHVDIIKSFLKENKIKYYEE